MGDLSPRAYLEPKSQLERECPGFEVWEGGRDAAPRLAERLTGETNNGEGGPFPARLRASGLRGGGAWVAGLRAPDSSQVGHPAGPALSKVLEPLLGVEGAWGPADSLGEAVRGGEDPSLCDEAAPAEVASVALDADLPGPLALQGVLAAHHPVQHPRAPAH